MYECVGLMSTSCNSLHSTASHSARNGVTQHVVIPDALVRYAVGVRTVSLLDAHSHAVEHLVTVSSLALSCVLCFMFFYTSYILLQISVYLGSVRQTAAFLLDKSRSSLNLPFTSYILFYSYISKHKHISNI